MLNDAVGLRAVPPDGYVEVFGKDQIAGLLSAYGPEAIRVHGLGRVGRQWVAILYIDPTLPWLDGHFRNGAEEDRRVVRGVEFPEIVGQAGILLALAQEKIAKINRIGQTGCWNKQVNTDPRVQVAIKPGDTVHVLMGRLRFTQRPDPELRRYFDLSGRGTVYVSGVKIATAWAGGWVLGRPGKGWKSKSSQV